MNNNKFLITVLAVLVLARSGMAIASDMDPFLASGANLIEGVSGEVVLRFDNNPVSPTFGQYLPVTSGQMQVGDLLVGIFDATWVNIPASVLEPGLECTGVYMVAVSGITDVTAAGSFFTGDLALSAVDPILVDAVLGVVAAPGDVAFLFEHALNDLLISTASLITAIGTATNGTAVTRASIGASPDFFSGEDVYLDVEAYSPAFGTPGVSLRGSLSAGLTVSQWGFDSVLMSDGYCPTGPAGDCFDLGFSSDRLVTGLLNFYEQGASRVSFSLISSTPVELMSFSVE